MIHSLLQEISRLAVDGMEERQVGYWSSCDHWLLQVVLKDLA